MDNTSIIKLQEAGYIFLRPRDIETKAGMNYAIMQSREFGAWSMLEKCATKADRARRMKELSELSMFLID
jgi:hypothetical protein